MMLRILFIILLITLIGCEDSSIYDATIYESKLVIDGWIEQGDFPKVILTKSSSYFTSVDSAAIRRLVVTTAKVTVSDGVTEEVLTLKRDGNYFPPFIYSGTKLKGVVGGSYKLTVEVGGEQYTATTTIPETVSINELWYENVSGKDTVGYIYGRFTDDPSTDNYYRIFTRREGKDKRFIPVYLSAIGDQSFNGKTFTFSLLRGPDSFTNIQDDLYFEEGDTVSIKFCTMDKAHFDFWRTLERELYLVGNPFSSSGNEVISNIDNKKALGIWGGYGVKQYRMVTKRR